MKTVDENQDTNKRDKMIFEKPKSKLKRWVMEKFHDKQIQSQSKFINETWDENRGQVYGNDKS